MEIHLIDRLIRDAHPQPFSLNHRTPRIRSHVSQAPPTVLSVTEYLPDAKKVARNNFQCEGSLAVLYDKTWNKQKSDLVFVPHDVTRNEPEESRARVVVRERVTQLTWLVGEDCPSILNEIFKLKGVLIRDEYRFILACIWDIVGERGGRLSGYLPQPDLWKFASEGPPYNPFVGLTIKPSDEDEVPGVVVTGAPGIGKSLFLLVVLVLCLLTGLTTIYQFKKDEFILFHDTWILVDSGEENIRPPQSFLRACVSSSRKLIIAASPRKNRFEFIKKDMRYRTVWMNPFTVGEYIEARGLQAPITPPRELGLARFSKLYGPSARAAFLNVAEQDSYEDILKDNIVGISWDAINRTINEVGRGYFETEFSDLVLVAKRQDDKPREFYVEFASGFITEMVLDAFVRREAEGGYKLYRQFLKANRARASAGNLLEALSLSRLPLGGQWQMRQMKISKKHLIDQVNQHWVVDESSLCPLYLLDTGTVR